MKVERVFFLGVCIFVVAGIVAAFLTIGPPSRARTLALDNRRLDDIRVISSTLKVRYGEATAKLPESLPDDLPSAAVAYRRTDARHYRLCATFAAADELEPSRDDLEPYTWHHGAGRTCYAFEVSEATPRLHQTVRR